MSAGDGPKSKSMGKPYTLRNPVPLRTAADVTTTRSGIPTDAVLQDVSGPVDFDSLAKAIRRSVGHEGMRPEDARSIAAHVLNFFGFNAADHRQRPRAGRPRHVLHARGHGHPRDRAGRDDPLRRPRVAHPLLDVPQGAHLRPRPRGVRAAMAAAGETEVVYSSNANSLGGLPASPRGDGHGARGPRGLPRAGGRDLARAQAEPDARARDDAGPEGGAAPPPASRRLGPSESC